MDGNAETGTEVPRAEQDGIVAGMPAEVECGDTKKPTGKKKGRVFQKVDNLQDFYQPLGYVAPKGSSKGKDGGKDGGWKGGKGFRDGDGFKGKGKGGQGRGADGQQRPDAVSKPVPNLDGSVAPTDDSGQAKGGVGGKGKKGAGKSRDFGGKNQNKGGGGVSGGLSGGVGGGPGSVASGFANGGQGGGGGGGFPTGAGNPAMGQNRKGGVKGGGKAAPLGQPGDVGGAPLPDGPRAAPPQPQQPQMPNQGKGALTPQQLPPMPMPMQPFAYPVAFPGGGPAMYMPCGGGASPPMYGMPIYFMPTGPQYTQGASQAQPLPDARVVDRQSLKADVLHQIEYYFGEENLIKDVYLRNQMNDEGWVSVECIAGFKRLQSLTEDKSMVTEAIQSSERLEMDPTGTQMRLRDVWQKWLLKPS